MLRLFKAWRKSLIMPRMTTVRTVKAGKILSPSGLEPPRMESRSSNFVSANCSSQSNREIS